MSLNFYNKYHKKNTEVQSKIISKNNFTYQTLIKLIDEYASIEMEVLDVGCGVGTIDFYLASKVKSVTGMDISTRAIDLARSSAKKLKLQNILYVNQDLNDFHLNSKKYDLAICSEVIEHIIDDKKLLEGLHFSLKSGGILIISTPSENAPLYRLKLLDEFDRKVGHLRRYNKNNLEMLLSSSGFYIEKVIFAEGILRNMLYTFRFLGWFIKLLRYPLGEVYSFFDDISIKVLGESNLYFICRKL